VATSCGRTYWWTAFRRLRESIARAVVISPLVNQFRNLVTRDFVATLHLDQFWFHHRRASRACLYCLTYLSGYYGISLTRAYPSLSASAVANTRVFPNCSPLHPQAFSCIFHPQVPSFGHVVFGSSVEHPASSDTFFWTRRFCPHTVIFQFSTSTSGGWENRKIWFWRSRSRLYRSRLVQVTLSMSRYSSRYIKFAHICTAPKSTSS